MDKAKLKAICRYAKTHGNGGNESIIGWRETIRISKERGLNHVHYATHCSLDTFIGNIASLIHAGYLHSVHGSWGEDHGQIGKELTPLIGKVLGHEIK